MHRETVSRPVQAHHRFAQCHCKIPNHSQTKILRGHLRSVPASAAPVEGRPQQVNRSNWHAAQEKVQTVSVKQTKMNCKLKLEINSNIRFVVLACVMLVVCQQLLDAFEHPLRHRSCHLRLPRGIVRETEAHHHVRLCVARLLRTLGFRRGANSIGSCMHLEQR